MKFDPKETGKRIKALRDAKKMNQYDLAEDLNMSHSYIGKLERGSRVGCVDIYASIAVYFGVSLDFLVFGNVNEITRTKIRVAIDILEGIERSL